jgi:hypothetical protein
MSQNFWFYWNRGVRWSFSALTGLPELAAESTQQAWDAVQHAVK